MPRAVLLLVMVFLHHIALGGRKLRLRIYFYLYRNKKQLRKERAMAEGMEWDSDEYEADPEGFKKKYQSMVTYDKGGDRGLTKKDKMDNRGLGPGHDK